MECNKDEAVRARKIAESRMQRGEFVEALKFATKAKKLYADVESIAQILAVCQVHDAARNKVSDSEMDWYAILQTEKLADEATIKKQYRKLALLLHPDKNKFAGAEAAFKLIGQANGVLGEREKRCSYDMKYKAYASASMPKTSHKHSYENVFAAKHDENWTSSNKSAFPDSTCFYQRFEMENCWTECQHCKAKYMCQNYRTVLNVTLHCQNCMNTFKAQTFGFGHSGVGVCPIYPQVYYFHKVAPIQGHPKPVSEKKGGNPLGGEHAGTFGQSNPISIKKCATRNGGRSKGRKSKGGSIPTSKDMESQTSKNVGSKRVRQSAPDSSQKFDTVSGNSMKEANVENDVDSSRLKARKSSRQRQHVSYVETSEDDDFVSPSKKPPQNESFNPNEAVKKNMSPSGGSSCGNNPLEDTYLRNQTKVEQFQVQGKKVYEPDVDCPMSKEHSSSSINSDVASGHIQCADADFNDFEMGKAKDCFAANQLWAIYDSTDTMPRFYALIKKVAFPFKMHITWLEPDPDDQCEINWHDADLPIACGKFRLGDSQTTADCSMFSHQIQCIKGSRKGYYLVYPNKGETWAIFRNWDIKWSSNPESHFEYDFEYVEILSDFSEDIGILVACLGKVNGFVSLFQKIEKNGVNMFFVRPNELYRFSHRIPSYKMTGNEREGVPLGSFEFDPAALPANLVEVGDSGNLKPVNGMFGNRL